MWAFTKLAYLETSLWPARKRNSQGDPPSYLLFLLLVNMLAQKVHSACTLCPNTPLWACDHTADPGNGPATIFTNHPLSFLMGPHVQIAQGRSRTCSSRTPPHPKGRMRPHPSKEEEPAKTTPLGSLIAKEKGEAAPKRRVLLLFGWSRYAS